MAAADEDLLTFCRMHLSEGDAERLIGWIAWRTGRNQALAGDREPLARLRHALDHWLGDEERRMLLAWMRRRHGRGEPLVPA